jgi:enterochelin esterase-like enzyme
MPAGSASHPIFKICLLTGLETGPTEGKAEYMMFAKLVLSRARSVGLSVALLLALGTVASAQFGPLPVRSPEVKIPDQFPTLDKSSNEKIKLLWIACGTADFGALPTNQQFKKHLDSVGVNVTYMEVPDMGHNWQFWRQNLADFVQILFK